MVTPEPASDSANCLAADDFTLDAIDRDAQFVGRLVSSTQGKSVRRHAGIVMLLMAPYLALFMHESLSKLRSLRPDTSAYLPDDVKEIVKRSRHSLKLFEDSHRSIEEQLAYFDDTLVPAHRDRFLGNTWLRPARIFETDLGVYTWRASCIGTTHGISLSMGMELDELLAGETGRMQQISSGYGRYFDAIGAKLPPGFASFVSHLKAPIQNHDRKSWKFYEKIFPGVDGFAATGLLFNFACSVDLVQDMLPLDPLPESRQTIAKIRFLTMYQVVRSLEIFLASDWVAEVVSDSWANEANRLLGRPEIALMLGEAVRPFRNTLMHYGPDSRMDLSRMRIDEPMYAMTEQCFGGNNFEAFESDLAKALASVQSFFRESRGLHSI